MVPEICVLPPDWPLLYTVSLAPIICSRNNLKNIIREEHWRIQGERQGHMPPGYKFFHFHAGFGKVFAK